MTTDIRTTSNATYRQWLIDEPQRAVAQARAESLVIHGQIPAWREDALARAGDFALVVGGMEKSREFAKQFETGA
jgi:hypothetical protein